MSAEEGTGGQGVADTMDFTGAPGVASAKAMKTKVGKKRSAFTDGIGRVLAIAPHSAKSVRRLETDSGEHVWVEEWFADGSYQLTTAVRMGKAWDIVGTRIHSAIAGKGEELRAGRGERRVSAGEK